METTDYLLNSVSVRVTRGTNHIIAFAKYGKFAHGSETDPFCLDEPQPVLFTIAKTEAEAIFNVLEDIDIQEFEC